MTYVVAFDGGELSEAALARAGEYSDPMDEEVVAVSVIPRNEEYARERGWIDGDEEFDVERAAGHLRAAVERIAPDARFRFEAVDRYAPPGTIASEIRKVARELDASVKFVGSDNAGGFATPVSSVGGTVTAPAEYDVFLVRHPLGDGERRSGTGGAATSGSG